MQRAATIRIGTLGSAATFAGEATSHIRTLYPEFGEPSYFPSMDDCWEALKQERVDVVILGAERTGQPHHGDAVIAHGFYVVAESTQPLRCNLYVKPGSEKSAIRKITGHGSIHQCAKYLDREFPGVPREMHELNSVEAARAVMAGDGTMAVVGSVSLPRVVPELSEIASSINDDALCTWWAVSRQPSFSDRPDSLVITLRCGGDGTLGLIVGAIQSAGYRLQTAAGFAVNCGVSVYDYLLVFGGKGTRSVVEQVVARFGSARLAGAYEKRS